MKVLVADDNPAGRVFLTRILSKWGHEVTAVDDGEAAWSAMQREDPPKLLILDWMMPGLSGVDLCTRLREHSAGPWCYIILLTARQATEDVIEGIDAGADAYLVKPVGLPELRVRVKAAERILGLHARMQERIDELETRLQALQATAGVSPDWPAAPLPVNGPLSRATDIFEEVLAGLGATSAAAAPGDGTPPVFTASTAIVLRRSATSLDLRMHTSREVAEAIYQGMVGEFAASDTEILDALGEVLNMCQGALKLALEEDGAEPITPVLPRARMSAELKPEEIAPQGAHHLRVCGAIHFVLMQTPARIVETPVADLQPHDILADPIRDPKDPGIVFLSRGVSLNERYIARIRDLQSSGRIGLSRIPVIQPSCPVSR